MSKRICPICERRKRAKRKRSIRKSRLKATARAKLAVSAAT